MAHWRKTSLEFLREATGALGQPWASSARYRLALQVHAVAGPLVVLGPTAWLYLTEPLFQAQPQLWAIRTLWLPANGLLCALALVGAALPAGPDGSSRHTVQKALMLAIVALGLVSNGVSTWMYGTLASASAAIFIALMAAYRVFLDYVSSLAVAVGAGALMLGLAWAELSGVIPAMPLAPGAQHPSYTEPAVTAVMLQGVVGILGLLFATVNYGVNQSVKLHRYITDSVLRRYLPESMVRRAAAGELELDGPPERREITVLFTDLVGFTALSEQLGAEAVAAVLNRTLRRITDLAHAHGATVDKFVGDGVMLVFGAPEPLEPEEQARRALALARAIHEGIASLDVEPPLQARTGINTGEAVVGNFGSRWRSDYTVIGPTVNRAARLEGASQPDRILLGERTATLLGLDHPPVELQLKGVAGPVRAWFADGP